jgi:hypothetical protein
VRVQDLLYKNELDVIYYKVVRVSLWGKIIQYLITKIEIYCWFLVHYWVLFKTLNLKFRVNLLLIYRFFHSKFYIDFIYNDKLIFQIIPETNLYLLDISKCMNFKLKYNIPLKPNRSDFYIGFDFFSLSKMIG